MNSRLTQKRYRCMWSLVIILLFCSVHLVCVVSVHAIVNIVSAVVRLYSCRVYSIYTTFSYYDNASVINSINRLDVLLITRTY